MSEEETERYSFDEESTEHLLFLRAVVSIVADGTATGGAPHCHRDRRSAEL